MKKANLIVCMAATMLVIAGAAWAAPGDSCNEAIVAQTGSTFGDLGAGNSRWYRFDAVADGRFPINTSMPGTDFDTRIAVFGACGGAPIAENAGGGGRRAHTMVSGFPGMQFFVEVSRIGGGGSRFELAINEVRLGPPCNPTAGDGDCFVDTGTPQCEDTCGGPGCVGCCNAICTLDAFCCDTSWDQICADAAIALGTPCVAIPVELKNFEIDG